MELYITILTLIIVLSASAEYIHEAFEYMQCSDTENEFFVGFDEEEVWHIDFKQKRGVGTLPDFAEHISFPKFYEFGVVLESTCKKELPILVQNFKSLPQEEDSPQTSIYPKNFVNLGVENTLVCHVTGFFPPSVNISWTKNNADVTEGTALSQYRPKTDGTFNIFSTLKFTPADGDIYTCTVNHKALQGQPQTKIWNVDVALPRTGPAIFCGLGLTLGLLGVASGTFFFFKGKNFN